LLKEFLAFKPGGGLFDRLDVGRSTVGLPLALAAVIQDQAEVHLKERVGYFGPVVEMSMMIDVKGKEDAALNDLLNSNSAAWSDLVESELFTTLKADYTGVLLHEPPMRHVPMPQMPRQGVQGLSGLGGMGMGRGMGGAGGKDISELLAQLSAMGANK